MSNMSVYSAFDKIEGGKLQTFVIYKPKIMLQYCMQFFAVLKGSDECKILVLKIL